MAVIASVLIAVAFGKESPAHIIVNTQRFGYRCTLDLVSSDGASWAATEVHFGKDFARELVDGIRTSSVREVPIGVASKIFSQASEACTTGLDPQLKPWLVMDGMGEACSLVELNREGSVELLELIDPLWDDKLVEEAATSIALRQIVLDESGATDPKR